MTDIFADSPESTIQDLNAINQQQLFTINNLQFQNAKLTRQTQGGAAADCGA